MNKNLEDALNSIELNSHILGIDFTEELSIIFHALHDAEEQKKALNTILKKNISTPKYEHNTSNDPLDITDIGCGDIIELFNSEDFRIVLTDEWDYKTNPNGTIVFVPDEDTSDWIDISLITKVWKEDINGDYKLFWIKGE